MADSSKVLNSEMASKVRELYTNDDNFNNKYEGTFESKASNQQAISKITEGQLDGIQASALDEKLSDGVFREDEQAELVSKYKIDNNFLNEIRQASGTDTTILESQLKIFKENLDDTKCCSIPLVCGRRSIHQNHSDDKFDILEGYAKEHPEQADKITDVLRQISEEAKDDIIREYAKGSISRINGTQDQCLTWEMALDLSRGLNGKYTYTDIRKTVRATTDNKLSTWQGDALASVIHDGGFALNDEQRKMLIEEYDIPPSFLERLFGPDGMALIRRRLVGAGDAAWRSDVETFGEWAKNQPEDVRMESAYILKSLAESERSKTDTRRAAAEWHAKLMGFKVDEALHPSID